MRRLSIASHPELREDTPIKLSFTVPSLAEAQGVAADGNIFQVREQVRQATV